jgi:L-seryl-tRNA(Ser) seleniumtransferase
MLDDDPRPRAQRLAAELGGELVDAVAKVGGGTLPLLELPGPAVAIDAGRAGLTADELALRLRAGDPPLIARIEDGRLLLDPRTLGDDEIGQAVATVRTAVQTAEA